MPEMIPGVIITHIIGKMLDDGAVYYWLITNDPEPDVDKIPPEAMHGPFKTHEAALADADRALSLLGRERTNERNG